MTAVEKLEISLLGIISFDSEELRAKYKERIANAKEIEKQWIIDAWDNGYDKGFGYSDAKFDSAEQYYNEQSKDK